jgi:hypothetical protein
MNDKKRKSDELFNGLIRRAIVPRGFRPVNDEEVESMLEGMQGEEMPTDKYQRMLAKIEGGKPLAWESEDQDESLGEWDSESKEASEFASLFCSEGDEDLSPEMKEKLAEFEKRAAQPPEEDDESDAD